MKDALVNWQDSDLITGSLWNLGARDKRGAHAETGGFHGLMVPQIPYQLIRRFTEPEDLILDLFLGSGTSGLVARELGRHFVGVELNPETATAARDLIHAQPNPHHVLSHVIEGDSQDLLATTAAFGVAALGTGRAAADLTILHSPYGPIIRFSEDPQDLSTLSLVDFRAAMKTILQNACALTASKGYVAMVMGDAYSKGTYHPLTSWVIEDVASNNKALVLKAICAKNIQGNEKGKGKSQNLWRWRALKNGLYTFDFEWIVIWQKK